MPDREGFEEVREEVVEDDQREGGKSRLNESAKPRANARGVVSYFGDRKRNEGGAAHLLSRNLASFGTVSLTVSQLSNEASAATGTDQTESRNSMTKTTRTRRMKVEEFERLRFPQLMSRGSGAVKTDRSQNADEYVCGMVQLTKFSLELSRRRVMNGLSRDLLFARSGS